MEQESKIILTAETNIAKALKEIGGLTVKLDQLKEAQKKVDKSTEEGKVKYTRLGVEIKKVSSEIRSHEKNLLLSTNALDKNTDSATKLRSAQSLLSNEINGYVAQLVEMVKNGEEGSDTFIDLANKSKELQAELNKTKESTKFVNEMIGKIKPSASNSTTAIKGLSVALKGVVGASGLIVSSMAIFGDENKKAEEIIKNLQIALTAVISAQTMLNALQQQGTLIKAKDLIISKAHALQTWAMDKAVKASTGSFKIFNIVVSANPLGVIVVSAIALAGALAYLTSKLNIFNKEQSNLHMFSTESIKSIVDQSSELGKYADKIEDAVNGIGNLNTALKEYNDKYKDGLQLTSGDIESGSYKKIIADQKQLIKVKQEIADIEAEINKNEAKTAETRQNGLGFWDKLKERSIVNWLVPITEAVKDSAEQTENYIKSIDDKTDGLRLRLTELNKEVNKDSSNRLSQEQSKELEKAQIDNIKNAQKREIALLKLNYSEKRAEFANNAEMLQQLEIKHNSELLEINKKYVQQSREKSLKLLELDHAVQQSKFEIEKATALGVLEQVKASEADKFKAGQEWALKGIQNAQQWEKEKLAEQLKGLAITEQEYKKHLERLDSELKLFNAEQHNDQVSFINTSGEKLKSLLARNIKEEIAQLNKEYSEAEKQINNDDSLSEGDKIMRTTLLREEQEKRITALKTEQIDEAYKYDIEKFADNAQKHLQLEVQKIKDIINLRKESGLDTGAEEVKLRELERKLLNENKAYEIALSNKTAKELYEIKKKNLLDMLALAKGNVAEEAKIKSDLKQLDVDYYAEMGNTALETISAIGDAFGALFDLLNTLGEAERERAEEDSRAQQEQIDTQVSAGIISAREGAKQKAEIEKDLELKKAEIARKEAIRNKAVTVFEIGMSVTRAIMSAIAKSPLTMGMPWTALIGAMGALQSATVASTPLPKASRGRLIGGKSHLQGGEIIEAEAGEMIINKRSASMFAPILSLMNQAGGGVPFTRPFSDGGFTVREQQKQSGTAFEFDYKKLGRVIAESTEKELSLKELKDAKRKEVSIGY